MNSERVVRFKVEALAARIFFVQDSDPRIWSTVVYALIVHDGANRRRRPSECPSSDRNKVEVNFAPSFVDSQPLNLPFAGFSEHLLLSVRCSALAQNPGHNCSNIFSTSASRLPVPENPAIGVVTMDFNSSSPFPEGVISFLDTDLYKLTMQCAVFKCFRDVPVTYAFTNRTPDKKLSRVAFRWLEDQINSKSRSLIEARMHANV